MNSIEEDIKNLKEIINLCNEELDNEDENVTAVLDLVDLKSLRNLINRNKELEEKLDETLNTNLALVQGNANSIPVSLVEEKIEELIKEGRHYNANKIEVLQELLEKRKVENGNWSWRLCEN